jgi:uncharacterized membrane protein
MDMVSQTFMGAYFWGTYIWFTVGFLLIAVPAIMEITKIISTKK